MAETRILVRYKSSLWVVGRIGFYLPRRPNVVILNYIFIDQTHKFVNNLFRTILMTKLSKIALQFQM